MTVARSLLLGAGCFWLLAGWGFAAVGAKPPLKKGFLAWAMSTEVTRVACQRHRIVIIFKEECSRVGVHV